MKNTNFLIIFIGLLTSTPLLHADTSCDCSQIVGQCSASLKLTSVTGTPPSVSANYSINTTTSSCAKVSYYIDNTPYFNILSNTNTTTDSTFGTKPISMKNFSGVKCEVCKSNQNKINAEIKSNDQNNINENKLNNYNGSWRATYYYLTITNAQDNIKIYYNFDGSPSPTNKESGYADNPRFDGDTLVYSWSMGSFGRNKCRFRVTGQNTAEAICTNFTGRHTIPFTRM